MSIPHWAVKGAKVVCVDGDFPYCTLKNLPTEGAVYTVRETCVHPSGAPALRLEEVRNDPAQYIEAFEEGWLKLSRFRPLITRTLEQDVAQFRDLLADNPTRVPETSFQHA